MAKVQSKEQMAKLENRNNVWVKLDAGEYKIRILGDIEYVLQHKVEAKGKVRFLICPTEMARVHNESCADGEQMAVPTCPLCEAGNKVDTKYFAPALMRYENDKFEVGVIGQNSILKKAANLEFDPDFGDVKALDLKIKATGQGLERRYEVNALSKEKSAPLSEKEQEAVNTFFDKVDMAELSVPADDLALAAAANGDDIPF